MQHAHHHQSHQQVLLGTRSMPSSLPPKTTIHCPIVTRMQLHGGASYITSCNMIMVPFGVIPLHPPLYIMHGLALFSLGSNPNVQHVVFVVSGYIIQLFW